MPVRLSFGVMLAVCAAGCSVATTTANLRRADAPRGVATRLADVSLAAGADTVVTLTDGSVVRGRLQSSSTDTLSIVVRDADKHTTTRTLIETDIVSVGRVVGMSKPAREWTGAGIGVLVSLPLSLSRIGDASLIGASLGALVGRHAGDARIEIVLKR